MKSQARAESRGGARNFWVLAHRYAGLFIAFFLIVAGITGTALAFLDELDSWLNPELFLVEERSTPALDADALAGEVGRQYPDAWVTLLTLDRDPGHSVRVRLSHRHTTPDSGPQSWTEIFVDPFDGRVLGGRNRGVFHADRAHFMPFLYSVHYTLYLPKNWGVWLFGIAALVWVFDCFVGFYLTLPRRTAAGAQGSRSWWVRWQTSWKIKRGASATRLNFDLHRANGLWFWPVLGVLAFTGVYFNLTNQVFRPIVSVFSTLAPNVTETATALPAAQEPRRISFAEAIERAREQLSPKSRQMEPAYIGLMPDAPGIYRVRFADVDRGDANWRFRYEMLYIDGTTGDLAFSRGHHLGSAGDKFLLWQYPMHSGQLFGFWGRVFIGIVGLIVTMLSITGVLIWLKKRRAALASETARGSRSRIPSLAVAGETSSRL